MPGIPFTRFVGLDPLVAHQLRCGLCGHIARNGVDIGCGHLFCTDCLQEYNQKRTNGWQCADCGHKLVVIQPQNSGDWFPAADSRHDEAVNQLMIKCNFADNGCAEVMAFESLSAHLTVCPYGPCGKCGLKCKGAVAKRKVWSKGLIKVGYNCRPVFGRYC